MRYKPAGDPTMEPGDIAVFGPGQGSEYGHVEIAEDERKFPRVHVKYFRNAVNAKIWNSRVLEYEDQPYWERPYLTGDFGEIDYSLIMDRFYRRYPQYKPEEG